MLPKIVSGNADEAEVAPFRDQWYDRVQRILDAPVEGAPSPSKKSGNRPPSEAVDRMPPEYVRKYPFSHRVHNTIR